MTVYLLVSSAKSGYTNTLGIFDTLELAQYTAQEDAWGWNTVNLHSLTWEEALGGQVWIATDRGMEYRIKEMTVQSEQPVVDRDAAKQQIVDRMQAHGWQHVKHFEAYDHLPACTRFYSYDDDGNETVEFA